MRRARIFFSAILLIVFLFSSLIFLSSCNNKNEEAKPLKMVFLGDSIAEGILGPSPINERDFYGYYGVVPKRNGYLGINRAVSAHETRHMAAYIKLEDQGANMVQTHLKTADIISISILGNDLLKLNIGKLLINALVNDDYSRATNELNSAAAHFADIIDTLKGYNPDAVILVQTLYNPAAPETIIIEQAIRDELEENGVMPDQYREKAKVFLDMLNGKFYSYLEEHPGAFHIVDVYKAFDDIYNENPARGKALFFGDWVHPSNQGHAVIADTIQKKLEELGLANKDSALLKYKQLRYEQMLRLFPTSLDYGEVDQEMGAAKTCDEVTEIYFRLTAGKTPVYQGI